MTRPARPTLQQIFDLFDGFCEEGRIETGFVWKSKKLTRKNFLRKLIGQFSSLGGQWTTRHECGKKKP